MKTDEIRQRVVSLIINYLNNEGMPVDQSNNLDFGRIGINSVQFVKIVVLIEQEFDIEFEDDCLDINRFKNLDEIIDYIESRM